MDTKLSHKLLLLCLPKFLPLAILFRKLSNLSKLLA